MAKLWHKRFIQGSKPVVEEVPLAHFPVHTPTVIFLAGIFTNDTQKEYIAGDLNRIQDLVEARDPSLPTAKVYAWSHDPGLKNIFNLTTYNSRPSRSRIKKIHPLAEKVILPLTIDHQGNPLPLETVKANFRNLTLIGYSAGTVSAQEAYHSTLQQMIQTGFTPAQAKESLHEIVLINMGNMSRPSQEKDRFTTLYLKASNDHITHFNTWTWSPLKTTFMRISKKLQVTTMSGSSVIISAAMTKVKQETRTSKGRTWTETVHPLLPKWTRLRTNHEIARYLTCDDALSPFSKIVFNALSHAVGRTTRLLPHELLRAPKTTPADIREKYDDKMRMAAIHRQKKKWWRK